MPTFTLPNHPGEFTPEEASAWQAALLSKGNLATNVEKAELGRGIVENILSETASRMRNLWRRWKATYYNLRGNTLELGGPEDVHSPELYKIIETIIPRVVEQIVGQDPYIDTVSRKRADRRTAETISAYMEWLMDQAKLRKLIDPAARDMAVTQIAPHYVTWENRVEDRQQHEVTRSLNYKTGKIDKKVKVTTKPTVVYSGVKIRPIDPFDFIIHPKATNAQDAPYVGHRAWLTIDEIQRMAEGMGWVNVRELTEGDAGKTLDVQQSYFTVGRDPTITSTFNEAPAVKGLPGKIEVVFIYTRASLDDSKTYKDYRIAVAGARVVLELRENPENFRPYALGRLSQSAHECFGTGMFDNAIRLNQQLDAYLQTVARGSKLAGMPLVFVDDAGDLPPSLFRVQPGKVYAGVGNLRFSQIPDGLLRAAPLMIQLWQRNIEETAGSFRIQMGQQDVNGTATAATLALQEGNRRMYGLVIAVGDWIEQILNLSYLYWKKYSTEDVEFPVLGKRALQLKRSHLTIGPADALDEVKFVMVGLRNTRNYGLKITGLRSAMDVSAPLIAANPQTIDQPAIIHSVFSEFVGPDEADRFVHLPTPIDNLFSQSQENDILLEGYEVDVDPDDDDEEHLRDLEPLRRAAMSRGSGMHKEVRRVVLQHGIAHDAQLLNKRAREAAQERRAPLPMQASGMPAEAGGMPSPETGAASPRAGAFELADTIGNERGAVPGPEESPRRTRRSSRTRRPTTQGNNRSAE